MLQDDCHIYDNHLLPQTRFVDETVKVLRFEDGFDTISAEIAKLCNVANDFPPVILNASPPNPTLWDSESRQIAKSMYQQDFEQFGYQEITSMPTATLPA
jgi:hypothetical protein